MSRKTTLTINMGVLLAASALAACGGGNDFVSNQQSTIDGGIKIDGNPSGSGDVDNSSNAGKYPFASGNFADCYNAEAYGKCTIVQDAKIPTTRISSGYKPSKQFDERFLINKERDWFMVIPYNKSLLLPSYDQNIDRKYSFEYPNDTFDGLTNAVRDSVIGKDGKGNQRYIDFSKLRGYFAGNDLMLVRDIDAWGFQTIAQMIKFDSKRQIIGDSFFTVGQPLQEINGLTEATFKGLATGSLYGRSDTFADVTAQLKLPSTGPYQLALEVSNTQITPDNLVKGYAGVRAAPELDFSRTLNWNNKTKEFTNHKSGSVIARMYGPEGQEIGGVFNGTTTGYQGAFGAKR